MKLTNKFNLPPTFVNVIKRPQYSKGSSEISVTEILSPPQLVLLRRQHQEDIEQDAADMVWSLFGSAVHNILEHGKDDHHIVEERLFTTFEGWSISGAIDLQEMVDGKVLIADYKVTSAWTVQQEKQEWIDQLNLYAWLVERVKGEKVAGLQIIGIVRDWSRREAALKDTYPQAPIVTLRYTSLGHMKTARRLLNRDLLCTTRLTLPALVATCRSVRQRKCGRRRLRMPS
jgi:hypothetical protein